MELSDLLEVRGMAEKLMVSHLSRKASPKVNDMEFFSEECYNIAYTFHKDLKEKRDAELGLED